MTQCIELNDKKYDLDQNGYLIEISQWDNQIMEWLAQKDDLLISEPHIMVITYLREFYKENNRHPGDRVFSQAISNIFDRQQGATKYLYELFPGGFNQAYKIAGLPVFHSCC